MTTLISDYGVFVDAPRHTLIIYKQLNEIVEIYLSIISRGKINLLSFPVKWYSFCISVYGNKQTDSFVNIEHLFIAPQFFCPYRALLSNGTVSTGGTHFSSIFNQFDAKILRHHKHLLAQIFSQILLLSSFISLRLLPFRLRTSKPSCCIKILLLFLFLGTI
jgi:hypothetical protein